MENKNRKTIIIGVLLTIIAFVGIAIPFGLGNNNKKLGASVSQSYFDDKYVYFDLEAFTNSLPSSTEEYDYMKVAFALQGLINREKPILFYKYKPIDNFLYLDTNIDLVWESVLVNDGNILDGKTKITYTSFDQVIQLAKDLGVVNGAVLWDPKVPATSNVASTIAGVENLVPIRKDITNFSCYTDLIVNRGLFTVQRDLTGKFTGSGYLPDANLNAQSSGTASSGSTKNDAYLWAKKYYLDTNKTNSSLMGYSRDAWIKPCATGACFVDSWVPENMNPGEERQVYITVLNNNTVSNETWTRSGNYRIASMSGNPAGGHNDFTVTDALYGFEQGDSAYGVRLYLDPNNNIEAGERYRVSFTIKAPSTAGTYHLNLGVVHDGTGSGYGWFGGSIDLTINVGSSSTPNVKTEHYGRYPQGIFNAGLNSSDYLIQNKAFFFDLSPDASIAPIDDRGQTVGKDVQTWKALLAQQKANNNNQFFTVIGFVPWFMKYTNFSGVDPNSNMDPVIAEWTEIDLNSQYGGITDADAQAPVGLTNASLYKHQPLKAPFTQNNDKEAIMSDNVVKEVYDSNTKYYVVYMGDFDCGAWTSGIMPSRFLKTWGTTDKYPLAWQVNSDLSARVPHAFNWLYEHQNRNDYFVAGDNGSGYLNPMKLDTTGLTNWKNHNIEKLNQFDLDITGFVIAGNSGSLTTNVKNAYAQISPVLVGYQASQTSANTTVGTTPFISARNADTARVSPSTMSLGQDIYNQVNASSNNFVIVRTVQFTRAEAYNAIDEVNALAAANNKKFKIVDPYTFAQLYTDHPTKYKGCYTNGTNYQWVNATTIPSGYSYVDTVSSSSDCHKPRTKITKPTMTTSSYTFSGSAITPTITGFDSTTMNKTGDTSKTNVGNYSITISLKNTTDYEWSDGSQSDIVFNWNISKLTLAKPSISGASTFTYDGTSKSINVANKDTNRMTETGYTSKTNVGNYSVTYALKDKTNTSWSDNTTTNVTLNWSINKAQLTKPTFNGDSTFTYDGTAKTVSFNNFDDGTMIRTGNITRTNAGTYPVTFALMDSDNYEWSDGTTANVELSWSISKIQLTKPTIDGSNSFTYNGNYQGLSFHNLDTSTMTVSGNSEVDVDSYTTTISLKDSTNYEWSDGTTSAQIYSWSIIKADLDAAVSMADYYENSTPSNPVVTGNLGNGAVTYAYAVKGTENYSNNKPTAKGTYTVRATIASTANYNSAVVTSDFHVLENDEEAIVLPEGSIITDVGLYGELIDSYNAEKGTSYNYTHLFTTAELSSLKTLVISKDNYHKVEVENLSNLSYLTGLENLTIDLWENCSSTGLNLTSNTNLKTLVIKNASPVYKLDLRSNTSLKDLTINNSSINIINISGLNLENIDLDKPSSAGYLLLDRRTDVSYLVNNTSHQDETVSNNSFAIICDKYNIDVGETANCMVKGKTTVQMSTIMFKLNQNNENVSITDIQKASNLTGDKNVICYGNIPVNEEFNIITFKVTGVSGGSTKINLTDYNSENPIGYVRTSDSEVEHVTGDINKMIYVNRYAVTDASGNVVTTGNLKTNYILKIADGTGTYNTAYNVVVLGDVKADGIVNGQDVGRAYVSTGTSIYTDFTTAEKYALDYNFDGYYNLLDVYQIYNLID